VSTIEVKTTDIAHGGDAVARYEGKVLFVPYALPGEELLVELIEEKSRYGRARLKEVVTASPQRVEPRCPHFGTCGGCDWQHIAHGTQLHFREEILRSQLKRVGHLADVLVRPTLRMRDPWNYRNRVQLHLDEDGQLGFLAPRQHHVVPIRECHVMHPLLAEVFSALEIDFPELKGVSIRAGVTTGEQLLILETVGETAPALEADVPVSCVLLLEDGTPVTYVGHNYITENAAGRSFRISSTSFFQVNTAQLEHLVKTVQQYLSPQGNEALLDVYCGVGVLGLSLADAVSTVVGIDESEAAIADAWFNSQDLENVQYIQGRTEEILPSLDQQADAVILDPPRQGCHEKALAALLNLAPRKVVYVSCDPATLARDLGRLVQGGYELVEIQPLDMFPQTCHIEAVALLHLESP
jgi:23S rRNA (uracil1939-C5)-methyltransferase